MSKYKRNYVKGGTYFFTVVTHKRQKLLQGVAVDLLRQCFKTIIEEKPFIIDAIVILPDHLHCIWQRRFWEHTIQNTNDYGRHIDYIHYNPVKHGYSQTVSEWRHSSFHKFVNDEIYAKTWCGPVDDFSANEYMAIETEGIANE